MKKYITQGNYIERVEKSEAWDGYETWWQKARRQSLEAGDDEEEAKQRMLLNMPAGFGSRSKIEGFSKGSKKRLGSEFSTCDFSTAIFLTLTQSSKEQLSPVAAKAVLNSFCVSYLVPKGLAGFWRIEKQQSGNPHFHLIIFNHPDPAMFKLKSEYYDKKKKACWFIESEEYSTQWRRAGNFSRPCRCEVAFIWSSTGAYLYLVGHSSKANQVWDTPIGRYWGYFNYDKIPRKERIELELDETGEAILQAIWDKKEERRVKWLHSHKNVTVDVRDWNIGSIKLFSRDPVRTMLRYKSKLIAHQKYLQNLLDNF